MTERPFEAVAFHMYPVVGFSFRLTSTRSLAGTVRISPFELLFTRMVVTEALVETGVTAVLAAGTVTTALAVAAGTPAA